MKTDLDKFYAAVDAAARRLQKRHSERLQCGKGCSSCCVDGITVFEVEAANIRVRHRELLGKGKPHEKGACAFLDREGACRIYDDRPYVCRTQGLPLRWIEDADDSVIEYRDICPLNDDPEEPLESISESDCWTIGDFEGRLARIQASSDPGMKRVHLRSLFTRETPIEPE